MVQHGHLVADGDGGDQTVDPGAQLEALLVTATEDGGGLLPVVARPRAEVVAPVQEAPGVGDVNTNAARDYAMRNYRWFDADQVRVYGRKNGYADGQETSWREWVALPVTA